MKLPFKTPVTLQSGGVGYKKFLVAADAELICGMVDATDDEAQAIVNAINWPGWSAQARLPDTDRRVLAIWLGQPVVLKRACRPSGDPADPHSYYWMDPSNPDDPCVEGHQVSYWTELPPLPQELLEGE